MTPQTLDRDLERGALDPAKVVLLVLDEAHRATGNYAYCKIIKALDKGGCGFRIVALTATPTSKIGNLQTIISSLRAARVEVRDEEDDEIREYTHGKNVKIIVIEKESFIRDLERILQKMTNGVALPLTRDGLVSMRRVNTMALLEAQEKLKKRAEEGRSDPAHFERISMLLSLAHAKKLLLTEGLRSFDSFLRTFFSLGEAEQTLKDPEAKAPSKRAAVGGPSKARGGGRTVERRKLKESAVYKELDGFL